MSRTAINIGPLDHGRRMSLDEFDTAEGREGHLYELGRGIVTVVDVPHPYHLQQVEAIRMQFAAYKLQNPRCIHAIAAGGECKILVAGLDSERHPDLAIYTAPPPDVENVWSVWVPQLVIEVVSSGSERRDYVEKREEYLQFGCLEYWIVDAAQEQMLVLRRSRGIWAELVVRAGEIYRPAIFPGFNFDLTPVLRGP